MQRKVGRIPCPEELDPGSATDWCQCDDTNEMFPPAVDSKIASAHRWIRTCSNTSFIGSEHPESAASTHIDQLFHPGMLYGYYGANKLVLFVTFIHILNLY